MTTEQLETKISMMEAYARSILQIATELRKVSGAATPGPPSRSKKPVIDETKIRSRIRAKVVRKSTFK